MPPDKPFAEAERVMTFCNACRYCEGFCAVFPAIERRRAFAEADLHYLANLCHNCRDCYYACQYAPPHEFALNVPKTLAELRLETYQAFCWPHFLSALFRLNGFSAVLITTVSVLIIFGLTFLFQEPSMVFSIHAGENVFYKVIPYAYIVLPVSVIGCFILISLLMGVCNFWRKTGGRLSEFGNLRIHCKSIWEALSLKYLDGGGHGCNYPDEQFGMARRWLHHHVFYGFWLCFAATTTAMFYDHILHRAAPYPFWSWPVILGSTGGVALLIGTGGLLYLKMRMDTLPAARRSLGMDVSFLGLLFLTSLTGLLLLALRTTAAMGMLLMLHLGLVLGLFLTMPYGKFMHALYRYAALVRNAIEQA